jgi:hypothetical protein
MTHVQRLSLVLAVTLGIVGLALCASTVRAETIAVQAIPMTVPDPGAVPSTIGLSDAQVLDASEFAAVSDAAQRLTPYITVGADGLPRLADVRAEEIGVDPVFLENFRQAMTFANTTITEGHLVVNRDLTVSTAGLDIRADPGNGIVAGERYGAASPAPIGGVVGSGGDTPQWGTWHYPQGAMFYNTYSDYWSYYYNRYYVLCNSMAAALGYPWLSSNLMYFYAYNNSYFSNNCYRDYGTYFFLPYSTTCQQYNPCWCCGMSYRPVYFWVRATGYDHTCGCYRYNWQWQGYWARY